MSSRVIEKKLSKVLSMRTDSPEMMAALNTLTTFYGVNQSAEGKRGSAGGNTLEARRSLRADLEANSVILSRKFMSQLTQLQQQVGEIQNYVQSIRQTCSQVQKKLDKTEAETQAFLKKTDELRSQKLAKEERAAKVGNFVQRFQLSGTQLNALTDDSLETPATAPLFFQALDQVEKIQRDCRELLSTRQYQRVGMQIIQDMSHHQGKAYSKLFRWVQRECAARLSKGQPDVEPMLQKAVAKLTKRRDADPSHTQHAKELVVQARRTAATQLFIAALTQGGPQGTPRPIEMHAHDPLRYVGDMLAWTHQCIASERDFCRSLFQVPQAIDHVFDGLAPILKVRITQVVASTRDLVFTLKLSNLLLFYLQTTARLLSPDSDLIKVLAACSQTAVDSFRKLLATLQRQLTQSPPRAPKTLSPPTVLKDTLLQLRAILKEHSASVTAHDRDDPLLAEAREALSVGHILVSMRSTLLKMSLLAADPLGPLDTAIFMANCVNLMQVCLPATTQWVSDDEMRKWLDIIVREQQQSILAECGLLGVVAGIEKQRRAAAPVALSKVKGLDSDTVSAVVRRFYSLLLLLGPTSDRFKLISNPTLQVQVWNGVARALAVAHRTVYDAVVSEDAGYDHPIAIMLHSPEQVVTLLDIAELP